MSGNEEFPRLPRTRLNKLWNGVRDAVTPRATMVLTAMVAMVMIVQAGTLVWAIIASRHAEEARAAEVKAILAQVHDVAVVSETEGQSHRCRAEQLWREQFRIQGRPPPPYPPGVNPPHLCHLDEGHP